VVPLAGGPQVSNPRGSLKGEPMSDNLPKGQLIGLTGKMPDMV
jgi:hypothetical protein